MCLYLALGWKIKCWTNLSSSFSGVRRHVGRWRSTDVLEEHVSSILLATCFGPEDGGDTCSPKCRMTFNWVLCVVPHKIVLLITTAVKTSNHLFPSLYGAEHYSRGHHSIDSHHFMEPQLNYSIHKSTPPVPILSQTNPVHTTHPICPWSIQKLCTHLRLGLPSGLFPFGFHINNLYVFFSQFMLHAAPIPSSSTWSF
jgi:hypothetical protein